MKVVQGIEPDHTARCGACRAACTLRRRCFADARHFERRQARPWRIAGDARQTAVDHGRDAFDGDGAFGDVGGQNDLALRSGGDGAVLFGGRQVAVERKEQQVVPCRQRTTLALGAPNLRRTGQEDQNVS